MADINVLVLEQLNVKKFAPPPKKKGIAGMATAAGIGGMAYGGSKMLTGLKKSAKLVSAAHRKRLELATGG